MIQPCAVAPLGGVVTLLRPSKTNRSRYLQKLNAKKQKKKYIYIYIIYVAGFGAPY